MAKVKPQPPKPEVKPVTAPSKPVQHVNPQVELEEIQKSHVLNQTADKEIRQMTPGSDESRDAPSSKDHLLSSHSMRLNGKRRFMSDLLSRLLNCECYNLNSDKLWDKNALGPVVMYFTREYPQKRVVFDKFEQMPDPGVMEHRRKMANDHEYRYLYETPAENLTVKRVEQLLAEQDHIWKNWLKKPSETRNT